jgi:hypothetical protein
MTLDEGPGYLITGNWLQLAGTKRLRLMMLGDSTVGKDVGQYGKHAERGYRGYRGYKACKDESRHRVEARYETRMIYPKLGKTGIRTVFTLLNVCFFSISILSSLISLSAFHRFFITTTNNLTLHLSVSLLSVSCIRACLNQ